MTVIGRLDGQVEEVIINPVGRRPAGEGDDAPAAAPDPAASPHDEPRETRHTEPVDETPRDDGELPVWLL
jgi:hypothetical protein